MIQMTLGRFCLAMVLILAVCWWAFRGKPMTPLEIHAKAAFTRSTRLAPLSKDVLIFIEGDDARKDVPTVTSHKNARMTVVLPQIEAPGLLEFLLVVPRLPSQDPDGFGFMDVTCDLILALNGAHRPVLGEGREFQVEGVFHLEPGEYVLRYYRDSRFFDGEKGPNQIEWIGQGRLRVLPSQSQEPYITPMEDQKNLIRLYKLDAESVE